MSELLPCPFCGGEAEAVHEIKGMWTVECVECGALVDGIAAWNTRAERTCRNTHENRWFKCSACGYGFTDLYADDEDDIDEQPRFCLNCGAKVVSE